MRLYDRGRSLTRPTAYPAGRRRPGRVIIETPIGPAASGINLNHIKICTRCGLRYDWRKSPSTALKMTYCSSLCERADLGFTIEALLRSQRDEQEQEPVAPGI